MLKYQGNSFSVILSLILMTTLFYKALILQGEICCWSLLGLEGLLLHLIWFFSGLTTLLANVVWAPLCVTLYVHVSPPGNMKYPPDIFWWQSRKNLNLRFLSAMSQNHVIFPWKTPESPDSWRNLQISGRILFFSRNRPCESFYSPCLSNLRLKVFQISTTPREGFTLTFARCCRT